MELPSRENQLELFDLAHSREVPPHRALPGRVTLQVRHDQLVVAGIAGLIGVAVVFAGGVERGKQLVRYERALFAQQHPQQSRPPAVPADQPDTRQPLPGADATRESQSTVPQKLAPAQKVKTPTKLASGGSTSIPEVTAGTTAPASGPAGQGSPSRYAIQVVAYSRPQPAKQELERLQSRGERAFLVMRDGRTMVYVGPFPSKVNASAKLATLKARYQDCFVKTL